MMRRVLGKSVKIVLLAECISGGPLGGWAAQNLLKASFYTFAPPRHPSFLELNATRTRLISFYIFRPALLGGIVPVAIPAGDQWEEVGEELDDLFLGDAEAGTSVRI